MVFGPIAAAVNRLRPRPRPDLAPQIDRVRTKLASLEQRVADIHGRTRRDLEVGEKLEALHEQVERISRDVRAVAEQVSALRHREAQLRAIASRDAELEDREPALEALLTRSDVGAHVAAAIRGAVLRTDPFPFLVVDDVLPDELYDALVDGIPPIELFADRPVNKQQLKVPFELAPVYSRRVWRFLANVVVAEYLTPALVEKFREPLREWLRQNWPMLGDDPLGTGLKLHGTDGRVLLRRRGYRIPPHRDPKWGFLTCLLYLPRRGDSEAWGTQLYAVEGDQEARGPLPHWIDPAKCRLVEDVRFRRNRALVFLNSVGAHGASIPADAEPADLERYIYQFRVGPTGRSIKEMTEVLPDERRPFWSGKVPTDY